MAHATVFRAKMPFYILWRPDLWRFSKMSHMYKAAFIIDVLYKKTDVTTYTIFCSDIQVVRVEGSSYDYVTI